MINIKLYMDGDEWCALVGDDLQDGVAGFGATLQDALMELADQLVI